MPVSPSEAELNSAIRQRSTFAGRLTYRIRRRIVSGLLIILPIVVTFWILGLLVRFLTAFVLNPLYGWVRRLQDLNPNGPPAHWWDYAIAPGLAILAILTLLYFLGMFFQSRLHRTIDWTLEKVPIVAMIYSGVKNMFMSLSQPDGSLQLKRVVLVRFPHYRSLAPAVVMKTLRDSRTGDPILCVWLLTGVFPPAGFTLLIPESEAVPVDWTVNQTIQAIMSGGLTLPPTVPFTASGIPSDGRETGAVPVETNV